MQALHWLQVLTRLEILIPLQQLFNMFGDGVRIMKHGVQHENTMKEKLGKQNAKDKDHLSQGGPPPRRSSICEFLILFFAIFSFQFRFYISPSC
jgi:hypothetical protein